MNIYGLNCFYTAAMETEGPDLMRDFDLLCSPALYSVSIQHAL